MVVGVMALIAACAMQPGEYFAINMKGEPAAVVARVSALGFPVTTTQMTDLAASVGEKTMVGRTGGAPTFAVGMAQMFAGALGTPSTGSGPGGGAGLAVWYHFAIMFEALFILTTIDAGTRVGRFLVQDFLGMFSPALGDTRSWAGNAVATGLFVGAWGWFLYQGVIDPLGGINSLWPIFGVANQLLGVIAFTLGTTVLIKMGRVRYLWVTLAPLAWLLAVTMTAGWMKLFSADPRIGFLSAAAGLKQKLAAAGATPLAQLAAWQHQLMNNYINAAVTASFLVLVLVVVSASVRVWWQLLAGRRTAALHEETYVSLAALAK
jgi:carbon starvation protein